LGVYGCAGRSGTEIVGDRKLAQMRRKRLWMERDTHGCEGLWRHEAEVSQCECRQHSNGGKHMVRGHAATSRRHAHVHATRPECMLQEHVQARRCGVAPAGVGVHTCQRRRTTEHRSAESKAARTHGHEDTCRDGARCACAGGAWRTRGPAPPMHTTTQHLARSSAT
jgi:hypothetical protein